MMMRLPALLLAAVALPAAQAASADEAAFFYGYDLKPGQQQEFENGYREHLEWHRQSGDPLGWYGWYVITGTELSRFVDATIDLSLADFDARVDPAGDARHFERYVAPFVEPVFRHVYRVRNDLGAPRAGQAERQSRLIRAVTYTVEGGGRDDFEALAREAFADRGDGAVPVTILELLDGGELGTYLVLQHLENVAAIDAAGAALEGPAIRSAHSELWAYRDELSHFP